MDNKGKAKFNISSYIKIDSVAKYWAIPFITVALLVLYYASSMKADVKPVGLTQEQEVSLADSKAEKDFKGSQIQAGYLKARHIQLVAELDEPTPEYCMGPQDTGQLIVTKDSNLFICNGKSKQWIQFQQVSTPEVQNEAPPKKELEHDGGN